jgi:hypothetical protein
VNTLFLLMARYNAIPVIPLAQVQQDFFSHLKLDQLQAKLLRGEIALPVVRLDASSQKSAKGVSLVDLAAFIDACAEQARRELHQMTKP